MSFIGIMLSLAAIVWARFDREFGFTAAISPDGVRIRRGLTARRHDDPPGRIHALRLTQPLIWRIFDWYRVDITQAGNAVSSASEKTEGLQVDVASDVLLPVGSRRPSRWWFRRWGSTIPMPSWSPCARGAGRPRDSAHPGQRAHPGPAAVRAPRLRPDRHRAGDSRRLVDAQVLPDPPLAHPIRLPPPGPPPAVPARRLCARSWSRVRSPLSPRT